MAIKKILIIEDDRVLRENLQEFLELEGYLVEVAENGKIGVEVSLNCSPDIILCDIIMPGLDGYQVLDILNKKKVTDRIPFIFLSAKSEKIAIRKGMNLGADDYLTKPFEEQDLLLAIKSRLKKFSPKNNFQIRYDPFSLEEEIITLANLKNYIVENGQYLEFHKKENLYSEGEKANYTFLLIEGVVKTHKMNAGGKELIISITKKADFLGYPFFASTIYEETATALQKGSAFKILNSTLRKILLHCPVVTLQLAVLLSEDLSELRNHLLETAYSGVLKKTSHSIVHFAQKLHKASGDTIPISRGDLASIAGISKESFIRSLSKLKKENLVDIEGRNIKILNMEKLQKIK